MDRDSVDMVLRFVLESPTITVSRGALKHLWIGGEIGRDRERGRGISPSGDILHRWGVRGAIGMRGPPPPGRVRRVRERGGDWGGTDDEGYKERSVRL
jgi:hypothetical protein